MALSAGSFIVPVPVGGSTFPAGLHIFEGFSVWRGITCIGGTIKRCLKRNQIMKTKILLLGAVVTAFAFTTFAADALLSPRAVGNQIQVVPGITAAQSAPASASLQSPRAQNNQVVQVSGSEPVVAKCPMIGSPRDVSAAGSAARTACCGQTVANCPTTGGCGKTN